MWFLINYDIGTSCAYDKIYKEMERLKARRVLESQWLVKLDDETAKSILANLIRKCGIDHDDRLLVVQLINQTSPFLSDVWAEHNLWPSPND